MISYCYEQLLITITQDQVLQTFHNNYVFTTTTVLSIRHTAPRWLLVDEMQLRWKFVGFLYPTYATDATINTAAKRKTVGTKALSTW